MHDLNRSEYNYYALVISLFAVITLTIASCGINKDVESFSGIYRIKSRSYHSMKQDTVYADQNQVKVYTDKFYAYTNLKEDSNANFGFGTYIKHNERLIEHNIYSSTSLDTPLNFNLLIQPEPQGYTQTIPDIKINGVSTKLTESYTSIPAVGNTLLDGAWKLMSACKIIKGDTLWDKKVQFKIFHKGYFIFIQRYKSNNAGSIMKNGFGFGTFDFNSNKLSETNIFSTYPMLLAKPVPISIQFNGSEEFTQDFQSAIDSSKVIEHYKRIDIISSK